MPTLKNYFATILITIVYDLLCYWNILKILYHLLPREESVAVPNQLIDRYFLSRDKAPGTALGSSVTVIVFLIGSWPKKPQDKNQILQNDYDAVTLQMRGIELGSRHQSNMSRMQLEKKNHENKRGQEARGLDSHPYFNHRCFI